MPARCAKSALFALALMLSVVGSSWPEASLAASLPAGQTGATPAEIKRPGLLKPRAVQSNLVVYLPIVMMGQSGPPGVPAIVINRPQEGMTVRGTTLVSAQPVSDAPDY